MTGLYYRSLLYVLLLIMITDSQLFRSWQQLCPTKLVKSTNTVKSWSTTWNNDSIREIYINTWPQLMVLIY